MKAKLIKENLNKFSRSFGKSLALSICQQYLPWIDVEFINFTDRDDDDISYGDDEEYEKWDMLTVITGNDEIDDYPLCLFIYKLYDDDNIYIKFYLDSVAFLGNGIIDDEYVKQLKPLNIKKVNKSLYESVLKDVKKYIE